MLTTIDLVLFYKPGHYLDEGEHVQPQQLRELGRELADHLADSATLLEKLLADGWQATMGLYDVSLEHPRVETKKDAERRLNALGIQGQRTLWVIWADWRPGRALHIPSSVTLPATIPGGMDHGEGPACRPGGDPWLL
jgi:hypothetical protein